MIHWRRERLPTPVFLGFPCGSADKESTRNAGDLDLIPGLQRSHGEGKGYPLQYCDLENSMDSTVHGVPKSWTQLGEFHFSGGSKHFVIKMGCNSLWASLVSLDLHHHTRPLKGVQGQTHTLALSPATLSLLPSKLCSPSETTEGSVSLCI